MRLAPPYIGGRGRLTCGVLVGYKLGFLLQVGSWSPCATQNVKSPCWAFSMLGRIYHMSGYPYPISSTRATMRETYAIAGTLID